LPDFRRASLDLASSRAPGFMNTIAFVRGVVDRDAIEKRLRQAFARERAAGEARLSALDRHLDDVDRASPAPSPRS